MPVSKKAKHGRRPPPSQGSRKIRLNKPSMIEALSPELRDALKAKLTREEAINLEVQWRKLEQQALREALQEALDTVYLVIFRIILDRLGADQEKTAELVALVRDYLCDMAEGRLRPADLRSSLLADGVDLDALMED